MVDRIVELAPADVVLHVRHYVLRDDTGAKVIYVRGDHLGSDLTKRQAMALLDGQACPIICKQRKNPPDLSEDDDGWGWFLFPEPERDSD